MDDLPNFAAWNTKNLADFCTEAYKRMQEQQEAMEHLRNDLRTAMENYRKLLTGENK
jgi:hypothetical protein